MAEKCLAGEGKDALCTYAHQLLHFGIQCASVAALGVHESNITLSVGQRGMTPGMYRMQHAMQSTVL